MTTININEEKNGIEITFDGKPSAQVITALKAYGFRWSSYQGFWWARNTEERLSFAQSLEDCEVCSKYGNGKEKPYNLFDMTRTDEIGNNYEKYHLHDTKEIAAIIRKHIRERFKMCKWSVRSDYNSIDVTMKSSPWDRESAEVQAIAEYVYRFVDSYNYNNSDYYSDYFDVNFYGSYHPNNIVSRYEYEQREETVAEHNISEQFKIDLAAFEKAEEERKQREHEEAMRQMEIDRQRAAEIEKRRKAEAAEIEENHKSSDCDMWVLNVQLAANKVSNLSEKDDDYYANHSRVNCRVARAVFFDKEHYNLFIQHFLTDFSFLEQMGGSATDDMRVNSDEDYRRMTAEERDSVEWYNTKCVAIYCDNVLKLVIDPQGFNYARYVYIVDDESKVEETYEGNMGISQEEADDNKATADKLMEVIKTIFVDPETIIRDSFDMFRFMLIDGIKTFNIRFDEGVIRAIEDVNIKQALYRVYTEPVDIQKQFEDAKIRHGEKITVFQISEMGMMTTSHATFDRYENGSYAQYDRAVKMIYTPERKRSRYSRWFYRPVLIYRGWYDLPESVLYETKPSNTPGVICKMSKYGSCDHRQYDEIIKYFLNNKIEPIVNTHKPIF